MHLPRLPTTLSLVILATTATTTASPNPHPVAIDLSPRHAPGTSSFTGASTLTGPAPTIETDTEPVLNHAAPLAQTTSPTNSLPSSDRTPTATSLISGSILVANGRPIETLIPIYTGTPPLVITDGSGDAMGTSSSHGAKATGQSGAEGGGTLLDMDSSSSSSSGAGVVRWSQGRSVVGLVMGVVVGVVLL